MVLAPLPIDDVLPDFLTALTSHASVVLVAPTGAGKTTRAPAAILDSGLAGDKQIVVLQPRRVAARAVARRIAMERGQALGGEIGYQVRFDRRASRSTRLLVATEGVVLRMLQDDPFLESVGVLVFDEFHERSLNADLALGMARRVQEALRPDLRIVVMSATLHGADVARWLGGCPVVECAGRTHPIDIRHSPELSRQPIAQSVAEGVRDVLGETAGHVLAFLPGMSEIHQTARRLGDLAERRDLSLHMLHGDMPAEKQDAVLAPSPGRKVILATNVAETSITIDGVTAVVDSGLARISRFDPGSGLNRLELSPISRAAADQRAGRAGRTAPGVCVRLWPLAAHRSRRERETPEVHRVDLAGAVLQLFCWEEPDIAAFPWLDPPAPESIERSLRLLEMLGAVVDGTITPLGRRMAKLPMHPRLARLLLEGKSLDIGPQAALAAALFSERDPFTREMLPKATTSRSDVAERVAILESGSIGAGLTRGIFAARDQFMREAHIADAQRPSNPDSDERLGKALLAAFPDRVARRRKPGEPRALMVGGVGVRLAPESVVREAELFLCLDVDAASGEALVRQASSIERSWLPPLAIRNLTETFFDETNERIYGRNRVYYLDLLLEESPAAITKPAQGAAMLAQAAADRWPSVFPSSDHAAPAFVERVRWLREWMPELELPPLDDSQLRGLLPALAPGLRSFAELRQAPWLDHIRGLLTYEQLRALDQEAPERIEVPSGRRYAVRYEAGKPPVLAVRIQELFGLADTPRLAKGRAAVLLHLLAPNMRPQQITSDLKSFWRNTYPQVRKDLRGRYPKHAWPEDPMSASAQRRAKS